MYKTGNPSGRWPRRLLLCVLGFALAWSPPIHAAAGCSLSNPDQDIQRFFPDMTDYVVHFLTFRSQAPTRLAQLEESLGSLDPVYETPEVPYTLYTVRSEGEVLGYVFGANQRGSYSNIQVIAVVDASMDLRQIYLQKIRSPAFETFQSPDFLQLLAQVPLSRFPGFQDCYLQGQCETVPVADPTDGAEPGDFRAILRGLAKLHLVSELLLRPGQAPLSPESPARSEWIGNHQGVDLSLDTLRSPRFVSVDDVEGLLDDTPVLLWHGSNFARVYPLPLLDRHPVVLDEVGGQRVAVVWSSPSSTAVVLALQEGEDLQLTRDLIFGTRILREESSGTLWSPAFGSGLEGERRGERIQALPGTAVLPWGMARDALPQAQVLTSTGRGASSATCAPPRNQVLVLQGRNENPAWSQAQMLSEGLLQIQLGEAPVVLLAHDQGFSAFGRHVSHGVLDFEPTVPGEMLDRQTHTRWSTVTGLAIEGPLAGEKLPGLVAFQMSEEGWKAFYPEERLNGQLP